MKNTKVMRRLAAMAGTVIMAVTVMAGTATMASAHTVNKAPATAISQTAQAKTLSLTAYGKTSYGFNWTYHTNNDIANVKVKYDFKTQKYTFTLSGKKAGKADYQLVYYTSDKTTKTINVKINVDSRLNVTKISGKVDPTPNPKPSPNPIINQNAKKVTVTAYGKTSYGYNWTYFADNNNTKVTVKYDFKTHKYTFNITGTKAGTANMKLVYYTSDKTTKTIMLTVKVDTKGNVTKIG